MKNLFSRFVDRVAKIGWKFPVLVAASLITARHLIPHMVPGRQLTLGEEKMLREIFRDTVDYKKTRVHKSKAADVFMGGRAEAFAEPNLMVVHRNVYLEDFSSSSGLDRGMLVHEATHLWQFSQCPLAGTLSNYTDVFKRAATDSRDLHQYDLSKGEDLLDFNAEQQGSIISDYIAVKNGEQPNDAVLDGGGWTHWVNPDLEEYQTVLMNFLKDPSYLSKNCLKLF